MAILQILHFPDPRLRIKARPVEQFDETLRQLVSDMLETMYAAPGIGLAATQIDVDLQVVVIDVSESNNQPLCLINPEILSSDGEEVMEEGCLSVPGIYEKVTRAERVRVRACDERGRTFEFDADGLLAVCVQHEIDHLHGKVFIDRLSEIKRQRARRKLEKQARETM